MEKACARDVGEETETMSTSLRSLRAFFDSLALRPVGQTDDAQLLGRFLAGRSEAEDNARAADRAFEELVARHGPMVQAVCRRLLDDPADADDAFQATFLVLFRRAGSLRAEGSLGPWLRGVAGRIARRARADRARRKAREGCGESPTGEEPVAGASRAEIRSIVGEEIGRLPGRYRSAVSLCLLEGLTYAEAARRLACPVGTLGVRLARGRELLRGRLVRRGVTSAAAALALAAGSGRAACNGRLVRLAVRGSSVPSQRVAALALKEIGVMSAVRSWMVAAVAVAVVALGGGLAWVAVGRGRPEPEVAATVPAELSVARADAGPPSRAPEGAGERADPGELVRKQEENLEKIQSLKCVIELRVSDDGEKTWKTMCLCNFARKGPVERVHTRYFWSRDRDRIVRYDGLSDALLSPDGIVSMNGYDPDFPPREPLTPADAAAGGRVSATRWPAQPFGPWGYKGGLAADYLLQFLPGPRYPLRELREAPAKTPPAGRRDDNGKTLVDMALQSPDGKVDYVVSLSPAHGYAIAETQVTQKDGARVLKNTDRVVEFQEPAPGIFLAKRVRQTMSWAPALVIETVVRDVAVNGPVDDRDLALRIPEGVSVGDMGRKEWAVWGKGIPTRTYRTAQEYNEWTRLQLELATAPASLPDDATARRYALLAREFAASFRDYSGAYKAAKTEADRQGVTNRLRPDAAAFAARFLELAKQDPTAPTSLHALARAASLGGSAVSEEAVDLLRKNWAARPDVKSAILRVGLSASLSPATEQFLRGVWTANPDKDARAHAAYALASLLYSLSELRNLHDRGPSQAVALERQFGKSRVDWLLSRDAGALLRESEELMARIESEFAGVKLHLDRPKDTQTLGTLARAWLQMEEEPVVGRPAPPIEGKDLNGQPLRLSDYRGKVVVVVFWAGWCRPCMAMLPEEKALVSRFAGKPFALIGVNCDASAAEARKLVAGHGVSWPNLHDGLPTEGKIAEPYRVAGHGIPAVYVIDREGILRHKWVASTGELDKLVDALLAAGGPAGK